MLSADAVRILLDPFGLALSAQQTGQLQAYLDLLLHWNQKINLTAIASPQECVTRNFGESLYLAKLLEVQGRLLDVGSGAGFPGLALKILFPAAAVTLLEPIAKKRAFLKEAVRACDMTDVEVSGDRLEDFALGSRLASFDVVTARAVGDFENLIPHATICLRPGGSLCLWLGIAQLGAVRAVTACLSWNDPAYIPLSRERVILTGTRGFDPAFRDDSQTFRS